MLPRHFGDEKPRSMGQTIRADRNTLSTWNCSQFNLWLCKAPCRKKTYVTGTCCSDEIVIYEFWEQYLLHVTETISSAFVQSHVRW